MTETKQITIVGVTVNITEQKVSDLIVSALEGGSNYWIQSCKCKHKPYDEAIFNDSEIIITIDECISNEDPKTVYHLNKKIAIEGLHKMAKDAPKHFSRILDESDDAETADVFLQFCLFGEIVFG